MDLPNELLQAILVRVPGRDAGQVSRVCRSFYRFYQEVWVWRDLCRNELGLEVSLLFSFFFNRDVGECSDSLLLA